MCYVKLKMCWREPAIVKPLLMKTQTLSLQVMSSYSPQAACCVALLAPALAAHKDDLMIAALVSSSRLRAALSGFHQRPVLYEVSR